MQKIGYIRVSSQKQEDGLSIENQRARLLAVGCDRVLVDIKTGTSTKRESYQEMISLIERGQVTELVAIRIDRVGRSTIEILRLMELLQKYKVKLSLLDENFDFSNAAGEMFLTNLASFAQFSSRQLAEKQLSVHAYKRAHALPALARFGYKLKEGKLCPDDSLYGDTGKTRWAIACEIIEVFLECGTIRGTVRAMGKRYGFRNYPARCDFPNSIDGMRRWLTSPTLRGHTEYTKYKKTFYNTHVALVSQSVDYQIQVLIERSRQQRGYGAKDNQYPLSGLVYCICGARCSVILGGRFNYNNGVPYKHTYYICSAHRTKECSDQPKEKKNRRTIRLDALEEVVIKQLVIRARAIAEYAESSLNNNVLPLSPEVLEIEKQIAHMKQIVDGPGGAIVQEALEQLEVERESLISAHEATSQQQAAIASTLLETISIPDFWQKIDKAKKRTLFHWLIKKVIVRGEKFMDIKLHV